jgi:hypothetical protein
VYVGGKAKRAGRRQSTWRQAVCAEDRRRPQVPQAGQWEPWKARAEGSSSGCCMASSGGRDNQSGGIRFVRSLSPGEKVMWR